jgi:hypothetical protein
MECIAREKKRRRTSRDVTVRSVDEAEGPRETQLGRGIGGVVSCKGTVYDISIKGTFDDSERVVMLVIHEKDGQIRTDCKTEALKYEQKKKPHGKAHLTYQEIGTHQKERINDGVYQSH